MLDDEPLYIDLLRHGETEGGDRFRGHTDDALSSRGLQQMWAAVSTQHWDRLVSSPLIRCAAFASDYVKRHSLPLTFDSRLKEMHFGAWEGRTAADLMRTDADALSRFWNEPQHNTPPGGEPLAQFRLRVLEVWNDILAAHAGQRVLIVTHGGVIRMLLCHALQRPLSALLTFEVGTATLHRIRVAHTTTRMSATLVSKARPV